MSDKPVKKKSKAGAKCKYDENTFPLLAEDYARNGLNEKQIADKLGISLSTLSDYKLRYSEFLEALKRGKAPVDAKVVNSLLERTSGFKVTVNKAFKVKKIYYNEETGRKIKEIEEIVLAEEEVYVPSDTTAQIFWLKNRRPTEWKDKQIMDHQFNNGIVINQPGYEPLQLESGKEVQTIEVTANES
jgi:transcriptional regulator with XRE-family HTH domain